MAKKMRYNSEQDMDLLEQPMPVETTATDEIEYEQLDAPEPVRPVSAPVPPAPADTVPAVAKKRIRIRKKATKKLSVAVLCTNPSTRRFI